MHLVGPYREYVNWFRLFDPLHEKEEQVYRTLSYFDVMNFAPAIEARTFMYICLQDTVCPPSSCFAAYNHLGGEKESALLPDFGHEVLPVQLESMMAFIKKYL
jgi:cephalosporin-C deacetylase